MDQTKITEKGTRYARALVLSSKRIDIVHFEDQVSETYFTLTNITHAKFRFKFCHGGKFFDVEPKEGKLYGFESVLCKIVCSPHKKVPADCGRLMVEINNQIAVRMVVRVHRELMAEHRRSQAREEKAKGDDTGNESDVSSLDISDPKEYQVDEAQEVGEEQGDVFDLTPEIQQGAAKELVPPSAPVVGTNAYFSPLFKPPPLPTGVQGDLNRAASERFSSDSEDGFEAKTPRPLFGFKDRDLDRTVRPHRRFNNFPPSIDCFSPIVNKDTCPALDEEHLSFECSSPPIGKVSAAAATEHVSNQCHEKPEDERITGNELFDSLPAGVNSHSQDKLDEGEKASTLGFVKTAAAIIEGNLPQNTSEKKGGITFAPTTFTSQCIGSQSTPLPQEIIDQAFDTELRGPECFVALNPVGALSTAMTSPQRSKKHLTPRTVSTGAKSSFARDILEKLSKSNLSCSPNGTPLSLRQNITLPSPRGISATLDQQLDNELDRMMTLKLKRSSSSSQLDATKKQPHVTLSTLSEMQQSQESTQHTAVEEATKLGRSRTLPLKPSSLQNTTKPPATRPASKMSKFSSTIMTLNNNQIDINSRSAIFEPLTLHSAKPFTFTRTTIQLVNSSKKRMNWAVQVDSDSGQFRLGQTSGYLAPGGVKAISVTFEAKQKGVVLANMTCYCEGRHQVIPLVGSC
jgi:hypothetical protein